MNLNTNSTKSAEDWCKDYCDRSEYTANLTLVEKCKVIEKASWMDPAPKRNRAKPSLVARVLRFLGV